MANKRIPTSALSAVPTQQGQVLKGEHLALLREVLSTGVNANKHDIDRIISGDVDSYIYYDTPTNSGLSYLEALNNVDIGTEGFVVTAIGIDYYRYINNIWEFQTSLSLVELFKRMQLLEAAAGFDTTIIQDLLDTVQNILDNIDARIVSQVEAILADYNFGDIDDRLSKKADLVGGVVPIEQLPNLMGADQIHIGADTPEDENVILWLKLE